MVLNILNTLNLKKRVLDSRKYAIIQLSHNQYVMNEGQL